MSDERAEHSAETLNEARIDGAEMAQILDGIPGADDRLARAKEEVARGEGIPLDEL